ncbi:DUF222 domain-containing protein [Kribbella sp. NPDC051936]|uniref:HNH endonuclease n=1 Tax=Kribbella sp. NPDC051936 TaxID=3154946 RepID=UPI003432DD6E
MELLGERPAWSMSGGELLSTLDTLEAELARLESYRLSVVAAIESTGYAQELGARDTAELLRFRYRLDPPAARRTLRLAQAAPHYPAVAAALDRTASSATTADVPDDSGSGDSGSGDSGCGDGGWLLRPAQAAAIVFGLDRVRSRVQVEHLDAAAEQLVGLAGHLSPGELRTAAKEIADLLDSDGPEPEELKAYERESLTLSAADNGVKFKGFLANENAELLRAVVHAGARPHKTVDGEHDPRPRDKRQADALSGALSIAAAAWDTMGPTAPTAPTAPAGPTGPAAATTAVASSAGSAGGAGSAGNAGSAGSAESAGSVGKDRRVAGYGAKANITVTIDLDDLKAATADAIGRTVYSGGLSAATIRRLACDANIIPLVLGSNSEPLDVGRRERLITKPMRRALDTRDRGCVVCGAPPIICDAHHLISWIDGGDTKVSNLALLCRRHHTDVHRGHWHIRITSGIVHVTRPAWATAPPAAPAARRSGPPDAQPLSTAPPDTQPRGTAGPGGVPGGTAGPGAEPRRTAPPDTQPLSTASRDAQPRGTAGPGGVPGGTAGPGAEPRRTAPPDAQPGGSGGLGGASGGTAGPGAEPGRTASADVEHGGGALRVVHPVAGGEAGGNPSRWRADEAALQQAAAFAATG